MIKIRTWCTRNNIKLLDHKSIINDVWINYTRSGYEVGINLKTKNYDIHSHGGSCGPNMVTTECIIFEDNNSIWHTVEWDVPVLNIKGQLTRFNERCKDQVIIYYIDPDMLIPRGRIIEEYECPSQGLLSVLSKLGIGEI